MKLFFTTRCPDDADSIDTKTTDIDSVVCLLLISATYRAVLNHCAPEEIFVHRTFNAKAFERSFTMILDNRDALSTERTDRTVREYSKNVALKAKVLHSAK